MQPEVPNPKARVLPKTVVFLIPGSGSGQLSLKVLIDSRVSSAPSSKSSSKITPGVSLANTPSTENTLENVATQNRNPLNMKVPLVFDPRQFLRRAAVFRDQP